MKIIKRRQGLKCLGKAMYVIECPFCKTILASASEISLLPLWMPSHCDERKEPKSNPIPPENGKYSARTLEL